MVVSSSYEVIVEFSCENVPIHLLDFPVANLNEHQVIPKDMMIPKRFTLGPF